MGSCISANKGREECISPFRHVGDALLFVLTTEHDREKVNLEGTKSWSYHFRDARDCWSHQIRHKIDFDTEHIEGRRLPRARDARRHRAVLIEATNTLEVYIEFALSGSPSFAPLFFKITIPAIDSYLDGKDTSPKSAKCSRLVNYRDWNDLPQEEEGAINMGFINLDQRNEMAISAGCVTPWYRQKFDHPGIRQRRRDDYTRRAVEAITGMHPILTAIADYSLQRDHYQIARAHYAYFCHCDPKRWTNDAGDFYEDIVDIGGDYTGCPYVTAEDYRTYNGGLVPNPWLRGYWGDGIVIRYRAQPILIIPGSVNCTWFLSPTVMIVLIQKFDWRPNHYQLICYEVVEEKGVMEKWRSDSELCSCPGEQPFFAPGGPIPRIQKLFNGDVVITSPIGTLFCAANDTPRRLCFTTADRCASGSCHHNHQKNPNLPVPVLVAEEMATLISFPHRARAHERAYLTNIVQKFITTVLMNLILDYIY